MRTEPLSVVRRPRHRETWDRRSSVRQVTRTATEMAEDVRSGRRSARSLAEDALERIGRLDGDIGAFQVVRAERALEEADSVDARSDRAQLPLAGVPLPIKDNVPVE